MPINRPITGQSICHRAFDVIIDAVDGRLERAVQRSSRRPTTVVEPYARFAFGSSTNRTVPLPLIVLFKASRPLLRVYPTRAFARAYDIRYIRLGRVLLRLKVTTRVAE
jgi:hypothetical protein